jgi:hypothetical protein
MIATLAAASLIRHRARTALAILGVGVAAARWGWVLNK